MTPTASSLPASGRLADRPAFVTSAQLLASPAVQSSRGHACAYERLRDEVSSSECTAHDTLTNQPAFVNECDPLAKLESSDFDLYPITRELVVHPCVPEQLWSPQLSRDAVTELWCGCVDGYARAPAHDYYSDVLKLDLDLRWPVPLFGAKLNALAPVLRLCDLAARYGCPDAKQLVLHFVTMVVLQFYVLARRQFLQASADRDGEFRDSRSPWIFALFLRYDIKKGAFRIDLQREQLADAKARLLQAARDYDLSSLLRAVLGLLAPAIEAFAPSLSLTEAELDTWCMNKVFVTKTQLLVTSHFVAMRVKDYTLNILKSMKQVSQNQFISRRSPNLLLFLSPTAAPTSGAPAIGSESHKFDRFALSTFATIQTFLTASVQFLPVCSPTAAVPIGRQPTCPSVN